MKFKTLQENLGRMLRKRMTNGGLTSIALAKSTGLAQAHISNFLNGKRGLSLEAMDRVLAAQKLSVLDLLNLAEINLRASVPASSEKEFQSVTVIDPRIAASAPRIVRRMAQGTLRFPSRFLRRLRPECSRARTEWERFVSIRVGARDGMSMFPRLTPGATLLIDRHYNSLNAYRQGECTMLLVRRSDRSCAICYVEAAGGCFILRPHNSAYPVELLTVAPKHSVSDYIVGRVAYVGVET